MSDYAVIVSARMSSTRLPGKALVSYCPSGESNLSQLVSRWQSSRRSPVVIVATSTDPQDDAIAEECARLATPCHRGPRDNVVARMDGAIRALAPNAAFVARALADNPLVDVSLADWRLDRLVDTSADGVWYGGDEARLTYAATTDIWSRAAWDRIAAESRGEQLEHPGLYFWKNIDRFSAIELTMPPAEYLYPIRTELDTADDLRMFRAVWEAWNVNALIKGSHPPTLWALQWLHQRPEVVAINAEVPVKTQTRPEFSRGTNWVCEDCSHRIGRVVDDNINLPCPKCGKVRRFYSKKPAARARR